MERRLVFWGKDSHHQGYFLESAHLFFSAFRISKRVAADIERFQRSFLWTRGDKSHQHSWCRVCMSIEQVGIRVGRICERKRLFWEIGCGDSSLGSKALWAKVIKSIQGIDQHGWVLRRPPQFQLKVLGEIISKVMQCFRQYLKVEVVRGARAYFWSDRWSELSPLGRNFHGCSAYPPKKQGK